MRMNIPPHPGEVIREQRLRPLKLSGTAEAVTLGFSAAPLPYPQSGFRARKR